MLKIENFKVDYGNFNVLNNLNLEISFGTIHGLVGLNGSGKTTLLNSIYGLKQPSYGSITYKSAKIKRANISFLETTNYFYPRITGKEYLGLFKDKKQSLDIEGWNDLFELPLDKLIEDYSSGMKKKLAFIGVVGLNREIIILDEPFNGVDMETVQKIKALLLKLKSEKLIIITSHILESLLSICDNISYLNEKRIQFTRERDSFNNLESDIFSVRQDSINEKIKNLKI